MEKGLPHLIKPDLKILFVGINPGKHSGEVGHHFAGRSNRFWKFLVESGLTPVKYDAFHDNQLLDLDYGITNIVPRTTTAASELTKSELQEGAIILRERIKEYKPLIAAYLGKIIYQYLSGCTDFNWGIQDTQLINGVIDFILPNPSGLNRMPIPEQLKIYRELRKTCNTL